MKEKKTNKVIYILAFIIIIAGIIIAMTKGFKMELKYEASNQIELNIGKEFELNDVKQIAKDVLNKEEIMLQKVEAYEDTVSIRAKEITQDEKSAIVDKINEKYEISLNKENTDILTIPHTRIRDILKPFIAPLVIATATIYVHFLIRFRKLGVGNVTVKSIIAVLIPELVLFSIIAIARIPLGRITIPAMLGIYIMSITLLTCKFEKEIKEENSDEK